MVDRTERVRRLAALGERVRLAIVDELASGDRSPGELRRRLELESNLLAHHLDVLEGAGIVTRTRSDGDGRRCYVRLNRPALVGLLPAPDGVVGEALFVCTHNSARSQLAAATWRSVVGTRAWSAGTHPAERVHPGAVAAAERGGLDLDGSVPRSLDDVELPPLVITVCDRAHEELSEHTGWLHWSIADPVPSGDAAAFDRVVAELHDRVSAMLSDQPGAG
ncbi:MAG TPA: helix-turn-helix domain-containing protein [Microthrixaceae bacterium]|nr:helix-turn-helix domain-containing protein [Microthrixaceae bacterium]HMV73471.1 helix-turn-helix domain-containing protein [Microthrixaceae bacterium]HMX64241.1 helix-turn-helix domain-containing protein [Microthrixaceae bacterium]HMY85929.1 helix-turn-helix domain-containing protein [Microthrixaceae bacterium]HNA35753.1 helix-turn-helix domain-containing protein [Microthrixaceae bacterium]